MRAGVETTAVRSARATRALVYVIGSYPLLTTTFIDREIREVRRGGIDVHVVAVRRPPPHLPLSDDQRDLQRDVTYLLPVRWAQLAASHLFFALLRPRRFFAALAYLVTRPHPDWKARLKTLLHFGEGVYAAFLVRDLECEELHAHFVDRAATIALVAGRLLGKPYSLSIHAGADVFVRPVLLREKIAGARHVATCTSHNRDYVARLVGRDLEGKISRIHHGLDLSQYRRSSSEDEGPPLVLAVGQLAERKGFVHLVEACARLRDGGVALRCEIVGEGPQRPQLEALITRRSLDDVVVLAGALPHEEVLGKYARADVFALPCVRGEGGDVDGIPNVLAEAMASSIAVVSSDLPAIRELVFDGDNGLLVPPGDDDALARAILELITDPGLRVRLGTSGRAAVGEMFDVEANVRSFAATMWPQWFE